jgi:hypothetical protein
MKRPGFIARNALSIVFLALMLGSLAGQLFTGLKEHNEEMEEFGAPAVSLSHYLSSGHFLQATFENWESEFFQMALFVILTIWLKQEGSSESRPMEEDDKDGECVPGDDSPPALKRGGFAAWFYKISLSAALTALFLVSFVIHWYGSWKDHNQIQRLKGLSQEGFLSYLGDSRFWFESFQNWQSEFLSVFAIIFLSIYLRQKGSPQSKRVNDPHVKTGE